MCHCTLNAGFTKVSLGHLANNEILFKNQNEGIRRVIRRAALLCELAEEWILFAELMNSVRVGTKCSFGHKALHCIWL